MQPELRTLERALLALRDVGPLASRIDAAGRIEFASLALEEIAAMLADEVASLVLFAAADLNRTALRAGMEEPDAQIVPRPLRRAFVVQSKLPQAADFSTVVELAMQRRGHARSQRQRRDRESLPRPPRIRGSADSHAGSLYVRHSH
jgi:hypothetical protein